MSSIQSDIEERLAVVEPDVEVLLAEVVGGGTLRLFIDHPSGVTLELCERVTQPSGAAARHVRARGVLARARAAADPARALPQLPGPPCPRPHSRPRPPGALQRSPASSSGPVSPT